MSIASDAEKKIAVMQAFVSGEVIEFRRKRTKTWAVCGVPSWAWDTLEYRVKVQNPDWVDWDVIADRYEFMARDQSGEIYLFEEEPNNAGIVWSGVGATRIDMFFKCYAAGDAHWTKSLVKRPKQGL